MYLTDLKRDFFDKVITSRVLVLVNSDVDGVCATKILQYLFKCDHVLYTLIPVAGKKDMLAAFKDNLEGVKHVILLNCGATIDICDFLDPPDDVIFYILDNHRPVDVTNIYNDGQVRLMMKQDPEEQIPEYDEIFRDDDDSSSEEEEDEWGDKRRRMDEESLIRRRERREWEEKRRGVLFAYERDSYFSSSSALALYELAWRISRDTNDLLWWAIIGHANLYLLKKIEDDRYLTDLGNLQNHVSRLNNRGEGESVAVNTLKIQAESELNLSLYRHWSVTNSLKHTPYTASKFKTFSLKGDTKVSEFLADAGLPLQQCQQSYQAMDLILRNDVVPSFVAKAEKYGLDELTYSSFTANFGFRHRYSAADMVHCVQAMVEHRGEGVEGPKPFMEALDTLARTNVESLELGLKMARTHLEYMVKMIQNILDMKAVTSAGPFLYVVLQEGTTNAQAFQQAVTNTNSRYLLDSWDSNIIQIKTEDKTKFIDGLIAIMSQ